ncbi:GH25 family lysozyme [Amycolatopsis dongchuanensis]|uniref:GH25 family lysozyme n=1 Tax=Amycolatopsis dongchuanensis TaxID=1070866 RepID=UPI0031F9486E
MDPAGTTFGSDTSHHQGDVDFAALYRDGLRFAIHKAGQGDWADDKFAANSARSHVAGMITAAYWFLDSRYPVEAHLDAVERTVPKTMALLPDVESIEGSNGQVVSAPTLAMTRQFVDGARARGYRVPLVYLPRWYWQSWGSPSLAGLPPLAQSLTTSAFSGCSRPPGTNQYMKCGRPAISIATSMSLPAGYLIGRPPRRRAGPCPRPRRATRAAAVCRGRRWRRRGSATGRSRSW